MPEGIADRAADDIFLSGYGPADLVKFRPAAFPGAEIEFVAMGKHQEEEIIFFWFFLNELVDQAEGFGRYMPAAKRHGQWIIGKPESWVRHSQTGIMDSSLPESILAFFGAGAIGKSKPGHFLTEQF